ADWDLLDDVHSKITLTKNDSTWGTAGNNPQNNAASQPIGSTNVGNANNGVLGNVFVDQANFRVDKVFGAVDTTLGRQFYGNSGDMIVYFGPSDKALYGLPVNAIDAARFDWSNDMIGITGIAGEIVGKPLGAITVSGKKDLTG